MAVLAAAIGFACVWTALTLGARGELTWRLGQPTESRLWLLRGEDVSGVGWSRAEVVSRSGGLVCILPHTSFWTWRGQAPQAAPGTCECYRQAGASWLLEGPCSP